VDVLRAPKMCGSLLTAFAGYGLLFGALVAIPLYLHAQGHRSSAAAGLLLATLPVVMGVTAPIAGHFADRAPGLVARGGLMAAVAALVAIARAHPTGAALAGLLGAVGIGLGAFTPANNRAIMLAAPAGTSGAAAGLLNMTRGLGTAAGTAIAVSLLG
jgi:MFS family permease